MPTMLLGRAALLPSRAPALLLRARAALGGLQPLGQWGCADHRGWPYSHAASPEEEDAPSVGVPVAATVVHMHDETPVAKLLRLKIPRESVASVRHSPGQWVDMFIDHPSVGGVVGGYTIASTPAQLERDGTLDLVVKKAKWPPAAWVHAHATPGAFVGVRVGGSFTLSPEDLRRPLLCVAGGIGITPIHSMLKHAVETWGGRGGGAGVGGGGQGAEEARRALLLYSASREEGHAMLGSLGEMVRAAGGWLEVDLHVTGQGDDEALGSGWAALREGRVGEEHLRRGLERLVAGAGVGAGAGAGGGPLVVVCGPPQMTDAMVELAEGLGVPAGDVRFERWW